MRQCRTGDPRLGAQVDVHDREALDSGAAAAVAEFGHVDLLSAPAS